MLGEGLITAEAVAMWVYEAVRNNETFKIEMLPIYAPSEGLITGEAVAMWVRGGKK